MSMKPLLFMSIFILIIHIASMAEETNTDKVCFHWAFVYKDEAGILRSIDFKERINHLKSGNRLKIYLEPVQNAYIYLILYDSKKDIYLLFPDIKNGFFSDYKAGKGYYVPENKVWFYLKNDGGMEIFYLIVSRTRCHGLEQVIDGYLDLLEKPSVSADILDNAKQAVLEEIRILKKRNSIFQGLKEKPLIIAGDYRGDELIKKFIYMIEVANFYAKTIRVAH